MEENVEKVQKVGRLRVRRRRTQEEIEKMNLDLETTYTLPPPVVIHSRSTSSRRAPVRHHLDEEEADEESVPIQVVESPSTNMNRIIMNRLPGSNLNYNVLSETIVEDPISEEVENYQDIGVNENESEYQNPKYGPSTSSSHQNHTDSNNNEEGEDSEYEKFRQDILAGLSQSEDLSQRSDEDEDDEDHRKEVLAELHEGEDDEDNLYEFNRYVDRLHLSYHDMMKKMEDEFDTKLNDLTKENHMLKLGLDESTKNNADSQTEIQDLKIELVGIQKDLKEKTQMIGLLERKYNDRFFAEGGDCKDKSHEDLIAKVEELENREKMLKEELERKTVELNGILHSDGARHEQLEQTVAELQSEKISIEESLKDENKNLKTKYQEAKALLVAQERFVEEVERWAKGKEVESYMGIDKFKASVSAIILETNETMAMVSEKIDKLCEERLALVEKTKISELKTVQSKKDMETLKNVITNFDFRLRATMAFPIDNILMDDADAECDPTDSTQDYMDKKVEKQLESIFRRINFWRNEVERQKTQDNQRILELEAYLMDQKKINLEEIELYKIKFKTYSRLMLKMRNLVIAMKKSVKKAREEREALRQAIREKPSESGELEEAMIEKHQKFTQIIDNVSNVLEHEYISPNEILDEFNF